MGCFATNATCVRAVYVPLAPLQRSGLLGYFRQLIEDAAMLRIPAAEASFTQAFEVLFQYPQLTDTLSHMPNMLIEQLVDLAAVLGRRILELQQHANLIQGHVQAAAVPDE